MSMEEDIELRDLLAQTLENNGSLAKIRAQLRACVYLAFDEDEMIQKKEPLLNKKVQSQIETPIGRLMFCIVREFLEYFNLDYTISVYDSESYLDTQYSYEGRKKLLKELNIQDVKESVPILYHLIKQTQDTIETNTVKTNGVPEDSNNDLNSTFNLTSPTVEQHNFNNSEGSILSETKCLIDLDKSVNSIDSPVVADVPRTLLDATINDTSPVLSQKTKSASNLSSLCDLPPIQVKKSCDQGWNNSNDNFKVEEENYEDDFLSDNEINLKSPVEKVKKGFNQTNDSVDSSIISQDFELDSTNIDDILKSTNSNT